MITELIGLALLGLVMVLLMLALRRLMGEKRQGTERQSTERQSAGQHTIYGSADPARQRILDHIQEIHVQAENLNMFARIKFYRRALDRLGEGIPLVSSIRPTAQALGQDTYLGKQQTALHAMPKGEWVLTANASSKRRMLYIHGGAWSAGSPKSHRAITDRLAQVAKASVFVVDYRLLPEHSYMDGLQDCQQAYRWLLDNGPDGKESADFMIIAGDSAGGTHTLVLLAWIRDQKLTAPNAAIAFSPATDLMLKSLRNRAGVANDPVLGPIVQKLIWMPEWLLWCGLALTMRSLPSNPLVSPLRADLQQLAPTLIQVSDTELLLDGVQQYAAKAQAAGSAVEIQTWAQMMHVWQLFMPPLPEAEEAFAAIEKFLARVEQVNLVKSEVG